MQLLDAPSVFSAPKPTWILFNQEYIWGPSLSLSANGRQLAFFAPIQGREEDPATLQIWDTQSKKRLLSQQQWNDTDTTWTQFLAILPKEKGVIAAVPRRLKNDVRGYCLDVAIVNLPVGGARVKYSLPPGRGDLGVVSPDGKTVAVTCGPGVSFALHDVETGKELRVFTGDELPAPADEYTYEQKEALRLNLTKTLAFSPDGKFVAVGTSGGWVSVWDLGQNTRVWRKKQKESYREIQSLAFSPDSKLLAATNVSLAVWRVADGRQVNDDKTTAHQVLFLSNQKLLLAHSKSCLGFIGYDLATGRYLNEEWLLPPRTRHEYKVNRWTLSADGSTLAIWRIGTRNIEIWNVKDLFPR
ncbi:MAG: WD40 repeat domain-containing protein [Gemmataceae bacterium]